MDQKCTNDIRFQYNKNLDQNLAWLTRKTEEPKINEGDSIFGRSYPPFNKGEGGVPTMMNPKDVMVVVIKDIMFVRF